MLIRNSLLLSVSMLILVGNANAGMNFLPDLGESGLGGKKPGIPGDDGRDIKLKGCDDGYQTNSCTGDTPFTTEKIRAQNGSLCYKCRAFEANDCEKDGFYTQSYWDLMKPRASLNLPQSSKFAELFGNIFGFRNANANTIKNDLLHDSDALNGGSGGGGGGGSVYIPPSTVIKDPVLPYDPIPVNPPADPVLTLEKCLISSRKIIDKDVDGSMYTFKKTDTCSANSLYFKGEWLSSCDTTKYKYDSSNCSDILAGNKCGDKWDGCYKCSDLYSITNASSCKYPLPGVYEPGQTKADSKDIATASCSKTTEGCLYNCLMQIEIACTSASHPYTSSNCEVLGGASCTDASGIKRSVLCGESCSGYTYTASNCNGVLGGGSCSEKYKTCTACTAPKTANAARTACSCPDSYKYTAQNCNGIPSGTSCDGKYPGCYVPSFSDDRVNCGPSGSMC